MVNKRLNELNWIQFRLNSHIRLFNRYYPFWLEQQEDKVSCREKFVKLKLEKKGYFGGKLSIDSILTQSIGLIDILWFCFYIVMYNFNYFVENSVNRFLYFMEIFFNVTIFKNHSGYYFFNFHLKLSNNFKMFGCNIYTLINEHDVIISEISYFKNTIYKNTPLFFFDLYYFFKTYLFYN
jgi:hypothetical protein